MEKMQKKALTCLGNSGMLRNMSAIYDCHARCTGLDLCKYLFSCWLAKWIITAIICSKHNVTNISMTAILVVTKHNHSSLSSLFPLFLIYVTVSLLIPKIRAVARTPTPSAAMLTTFLRISGIRPLYV